MRAYAHTPNVSNEWHELSSHLRATAHLAERFATKFQGAVLGYWAGILHDIGKFRPEFQRYLRMCVDAENHAPPKDRVEHSSAGAVVAHERAGDFLSFVLAGHHGGLPDKTTLAERLARQGTADNARAALHTARERTLRGELPASFASLLPEYVLEGHQLSSAHRVELFVRMLFSCLVDADFLDTEHHMSPVKGAMRAAERPLLTALCNTFSRNQDELMRGAEPTVLNKARRGMYEAGIAAAESPQGVFSLSMPTGAGKTRAAMGFALKHALCNDLDRVIVAIPYTSIIEQNAAVYRGIFGHEPVLEHHSGMTVLDDDELSPARLAAENWDVPIVVTTTVQLFDSLFHNRSSRCRKLHNIARSVLVLDEVQTLPVHLLSPILDVLQDLVDHFGVSIVLCTATQPALDAQSPYIIGFRHVQEIIRDPHQYFRELARVNFTVPQAAWTWADAARRMTEYEQCLAVVNTRRDAVSLLAALNDPDALHLSTLLCGMHRREVLQTVTARLADGKPCRLVSTQVVEAGCDLDFPAVFRAMGPLDRIVQSAGRCNREGTMDQPGEVVVFEPEEGGTPMGAYRTATDIARNLLGTGRVNLHDPGIFRAYFSSIYMGVDTDPDRIQESRGNLDYSTVATKFRMIDAETSPVIVSYPGHEDAMGALLEESRYRGALSRSLWRRLQPYAVNVYNADIQKLRSRGLVESTPLGVELWRGSYDPVTGLRDVVRDPADLII